MASAWDYPSQSDDKVNHMSNHGIFDLPMVQSQSPLVLPVPIPSRGDEQNIEETSLRHNYQVEQDSRVKYEDKAIVKEELFPHGKIAEIQHLIERTTEVAYIGLEYIVEIQHNCVKKTPPLYHCLLCDSKTKPNDSIASAFDQIKAHLRSLGHKAKYIERFFPTIKMRKLVNLNYKSPEYREEINKAANQIDKYFGRMKVKIVVGAKLFKRRSHEIKQMIDNSSHYRETNDFLMEAFGNQDFSQKTTRLDAYEDAFASFEEELQEKAEREEKKKKKREKNQTLPLHLSPQTRNLDHLPLSGLNPSRADLEDLLESSSSFNNKEDERRSSPNNHSKRRRSRESVGKSFFEVEEYLKMERELMESLDKEKHRYLKDPHTHPDYNSEWERFYLDITGNGHVEPDIIHNEWIEVWKRYFFNNHNEICRRRKSRLMEKHRISKRDIDDYFLRKSEAEKRKETERKNLADLVEITAAKSSLEQTHQEKNDKEVTVISTLRLLSALENVLDDLGPLAVRLLAKANSIEVNEGFGESMKMVDDQEVFNLFDKAKEKLTYKVSNEIMEGNQAPVSRVCVDNLTILMQKSKCERMAVSVVTPREVPSTEASIKAAIAKTVVNQFVTEGKNITESQLIIIVDREYQRVKGLSTSSSSKSRLEDINWSSLQSIVKTNISKEEPEVIDLIDEEETEEKNLDDLSVQELAKLFKNFKNLKKEKQTQIVEYMKKMEKTNPGRVTQLKRVIHNCK